MIGGVAVITYGYQRTTKNIDVTILCKLEEMKEIHNKFINEFTPLFDNSLDFFSKNFVLPSIDKKTNLKIYFAAGLTIFNDTIIQRRKGIKLGEGEFYICTFKDLISVWSNNQKQLK